MLPYFNAPLRSKARLSLPTSLGGMVCGLLVAYFFTKFSNTMATMLSVMLMLPFIMVIYGNAKRLLWLILIVCLPITVDITIGHTGHLGGAAGYQISVYDMILAVLYFIWFIELMMEKNVHIEFFPRISIPAFFLIGIAAISMIFAPHPDLSWFEFIEVLKIYLSFLYLANNIKTKADVQFVVTILVLCLLFEGLLGFAQHRFGAPFFPTALGGPHWIGSRVSGTWVSYNDFAWYLTFILPIALSMLFSQLKPVHKLFYGAALVVGTGSLLWTNSRSGWVSFFIAGLFVCLFVFRKISGKTGLMKTFACLVAGLILISPLYPRLAAKLNARFFGDDRGSAESRLPQFEMAYDMFVGHGLFGIGLNNYTEVMADYDFTGEGLESITLHPVHNIYLHIAAEMGIFGIVAFIWLVAAIFFESLKHIMLEKGLLVYVVIGMQAGILAFLVHGFMDTASLGSKMYAFFWFFAGTIAAIINIKPITAHLPNQRLRITEVQ